MASRLGRSGAALLASMLVTTSARADPTAADRETARTLMDQGNVLKDKGNLEEALKRFKAADEIMHVPTTAVPVAKLQVALGLLVEARDTLALEHAAHAGEGHRPSAFQGRARGRGAARCLAGGAGPGAHHQRERSRRGARSPRWPSTASRCPQRRWGCTGRSIPAITSSW